MCRFCPAEADGFAVAEPTLAMLERYADALRRGWSPDNTQDVSGRELVELERDPVGFVAAQGDRASLETAGKTIELADGTRVQRLPGLIRWIGDNEGFIGRIGFRYQPGTDALPPHVLGHIGYGVVPWRRGQGFATRALAHMLVEARGVGMGRVMITCDVDNAASRRVIEANGGLLSDVFVDARYGHREKLRFFIPLG